MFFLTLLYSISLLSAQDTRPVAIFGDSIIGCLPITLTPAADGSCNLPVIGATPCISRVSCDCSPTSPALEFEFWDGDDMDGCELNIGSVATGRLEADVVGPCVGLFNSCEPEPTAASWQAADSFLNACPECAAVMANRTKSKIGQKLIEKATKQDLEKEFEFVKL